MVDFNRGTEGVLLPPAVSTDIWQTIQEQSQVMRLAQRVDLPGRGTTVPIITGDPEAEWVAETDEKPVSRGTLDNRIMRGYTLAVIVPFSNQFRRDLPGLYNAMVSRLPGVLATKFDRTVYGLDPAPAAEDFDTLEDAPVVDLDAAADIPAGFRQALASVATAGGNEELQGGDVNGWLLSASGEIMALGATDANGRPLLISNIQTEGSIGSIYGRPVFRSRSVAGNAGSPTVGFGGDWTSAHWGQVQGVSVSLADQATITDGEEQLNLWQRNMFAVRAEIEVGFRARDINHFVRLTGELNGNGS